MKSISAFLGLLVLITLAGCQSAAKHTPDARSLMLAASKKVKDFPKEFDDKRLVMFAHLGNVETNKGPLHVAEMQWFVIKLVNGTYSFKKYTIISFFTKDFKYVGSQLCKKARPVMCCGPHVLMSYQDTIDGQTGNAWYVGDGFADRKLVELDGGFGGKNSKSTIKTLTGCWLTNEHKKDSWSKMLKSSRKNDPDFPKSNDVALDRFAHLGSVETNKGPLEVVEVSWRFMGALCFHGGTKISFFTPDFKYVGSQRCNRTYPIRCFGPYVFMWGEDYYGDKVGNAWDLSHGFECRTLVHVVDNEFSNY